ncbi:4-amino-4-deoxy-L-arabinose transferase [Nocardioides islandensis]|uniref:4-amino-4-deoxy-L-arabinose transferase n=1 Tax=Nocardioides islandensis TaxID=433663 RepID=A0A930VCU8_9ACTN|nr:4-amino-4-deoxy-L-arabinose transferase [Nocardioides islandensis]MBF4763261.1 4-amino-4-deoxy-L-arabinose transferase [Nocardioides islandensis]
MITNAERVLELVDDRPPTLGRGRLVCIDGPAGSGKTTLATEVAELTGAPVVHMDNLYEGWHGLPTIGRQLDRLLRPLSRNRSGSYRRWDWYEGRWAELVVVPPVPLLVLEGVGAGSRTHDDLITTLVWVEVPEDLRLERGLARDGAELDEYWERWAVDEQRHFAEDDTRGRADLVLDGRQGSTTRP